MASELRREITNEEFADSLAQCFVCALPVAMAFRESLALAESWLLNQATPWQRVVLQELWSSGSRLPNEEREDIRNALTKFVSEHSVRGTRRSESGNQLAGATELSVRTQERLLWHLYEQFLREHARGQRRKKGVFYTPQPIVSFIVREIDRSLREEFGLNDGLADETTWNELQVSGMRQLPDSFCRDRCFVRLLDPAVGTGAFLVEIIASIHRTWTAKSRSRCWSEYVVEHLLPRLHGIEILPAPCLIAQLHIAVTLARTGFQFSQPGRINVKLGDALADPLPILDPPASSPDPPFTVVLGNPPFSSLSDNRGQWIARLVRGDADTPGYAQIDGKKLGERKTWLHDDYVKFIRLAQNEIEQAGCGIVGFVTNHGYLDNATFRVMRQQLLRTFPRIAVLDVHGNRKKGEVAPDGSPDENIFGLDQGITIGLFRKPLSDGPAQVEHAELWGSREAKLQTLASDSLTRSQFVAVAPDYRFVPPNESFTPYESEYHRGHSLASIMPVATTAPVTARDRFVIALTAEELCLRIAEFRDLSIPDEEIRRRYFTRTRSARHAPGDTRSWKLAEARRTLAGESDWQRFILRCQYRPFDYRYIFWHPAMIDWPRTAVTEHLLKDNGRNLALIARRQMLPTHPCTFFWITDTLALDGIIRNDNLGSESLFPLYVYGQDAIGETVCRPNLSAEFIGQLKKQLGWHWLDHGRGDLQQTFGPEDVLDYIYGLFHSPTYRQRYASELRRNFPRVLLPRTTEVFAALARIGARLIDLHLLRGAPPIALKSDEIRAAVECFRVGGHEVCRKWLQPPVRSAGSAKFERIQAALGETLRRMSQVDAVIAEHSGWTQAIVVE